MAVQALIAISPKAFVLLWWFALLFHAVCIMYAVGVISVHRYITAQNLQVIVDYLGHNAFGYFRPVIATMYCVIACHAGEMLRTVVFSLHAREFRFTMKVSSPKATSGLEAKLAETRGPTEADIVPAAAPPAMRFARLRRLYSSISARLESYSIAGPKYDLGFFVFESIELCLQTYQAYKLSFLVSTVWINRLYAIVLISNCWSTAIVHKFLHANQLVKRVLLVAVDMLFDMITNLIIPFVIFVPYYWQFDTELRDFPMENYYHDVWLIRAISENQQVFVTSWLDFVSKMSPHLSLFSAVWMLKSTLIVETTVQTKTIAKVTAEGTTDAQKPKRFHLTWPEWRKLMPTANTSVRTVHARQTITSRLSTAMGLSKREREAMIAELFAKRTHLVHDLFFVFLGLAILVIHLHTTYVAFTGNGTGCMLAMRPWLATEPTCSVMEINCARGEHDNGMDSVSFHKMLTSVEPKSIKALVLSGCPQLHMPPAIQLLPALLIFKIYNSTIEQWDASSELRDDFNPSLLMVYFCDTNFTRGEVPVGILGNNIPHQLVDVEFSGTNLVGLPTDLHTAWPSIMYFVLERSPGITAFPESIITMNIPQLMLGSNSITSIPDDWLAGQAFWKLMLDGNALEKMPNAIGPVRDLYKVGFAYTEVAALPDWALTSSSSTTDNADVPFLGYADVFAGGSPLCASVEKNSSLIGSLRSWFHLDCSLDVPTHAYPVEREREWRAAAQAELF